MIDRINFMRTFIFEKICNVLAKASDKHRQRQLFVLIIP